MLRKADKLTGREARMRQFKQLHAGAGLNLVSLMDIFTILVFFLLVNSGAEQLPNSKDVKLPVSVATKMPDENLVLTVTKSSILVQGKEVAKLQEVALSTEPLIGGLGAELRVWGRSGVGNGNGDARSIVIMGDETIPYAVLGKILATCQDANYSNIQFAAQQLDRPVKNEI